MARFFESITLTNFLSFGPESTTLELEDVNVLVGANGSGKSNLIEAINVLRHAPRDIARVLREGGGVREWFWKDDQGRAAGDAQLEIVIGAGVIAVPATRYQLRLGVDNNWMVILDERIEDEKAQPGGLEPDRYFGVTDGVATMKTRLSEELALPRQVEIDRGKSILAQFRDPQSYPELTRLGDLLGQARSYCNWSSGPRSPIRQSCRADVGAGRLEEDLSNLPARVSRLKGIPKVKRRLLELLSEVSPAFGDVEIEHEGGALQLYLFEGDRKIASQRLSDGTLRYLMLIAILLDPDPPPLVVIEEPEVCLHADMFPSLRKLMLEAGERTQIIMTTQSPTFLDAWTDHPSYVVVCERDDGSTSVQRLKPDDIDERKGLGLRWSCGEIGGTRW